ncbi:MAG TPA: WD40 repeat domain-containing protein [Gemmataceae bacterium]|nr:WD40 repeat domain-containing protein [Gemmataceae bacterium]
MLVLKGHTARQTVHSLAFAPDGASLVSCSLDGTVRLWNLQAGTSQLIGHLFGYASRCIAFAPNGRTVAWCDRPNVQQGDLRWQIVTYELDGNVGAVFPTAEDDYHDDFKVCYSPDGRLLAAAGPNVYLWDATTREQLTRWGDETVSGCLTFSPDGQTLAVGHSHRSARTGRLRHEAVVYDPETRNVHGLWPSTRRIKNLAFAANGRTLAAACGNYLTVWETPAEKPVFECKGGSRHFQGIAFTPDGQFLAATHNDKTVRMWSTRDWTERAAFDWGIGEVVCIAFAPDGMRAAAGGRSGCIVVWDVDL